MRLHEEFKIFEELFESDSSESTSASSTPRLWKNPDGVEINLDDPMAVYKEIKAERARYQTKLRQMLSKDSPKHKTQADGTVVSQKESPLQHLVQQAKRNSRSLADEIKRDIDAHESQYRVYLKSLVNPATIWHHKKTAYDMATEEGALAYVDRMATNSLGTLSTPDRIIAKLQQLKAEIPAKLKLAKLPDIAAKVDLYIDKQINELKNGGSAAAMKANSKRDPVIRQTSKRPYDLTNSLHIAPYITEKTKDILKANPSMTKLDAEIAVCDEVISDLSKDKSNPAIMTVLKTFEAHRNRLKPERIDLTDLDNILNSEDLEMKNSTTINEDISDTEVIEAESLGVKITVAKKDSALAKKLDRKARNTWLRGENGNKDTDDLCDKYGITDWSGAELFDKFATEAGLEFDLVEEESLKEATDIHDVEFEITYSFPGGPVNIGYLDAEDENQAREFFLDYLAENNEIEYDDDVNIISIKPTGKSGNLFAKFTEKLKEEPYRRTVSRGKSLADNDLFVDFELLEESTAGADKYYYVVCLEDTAKGKKVLDAGVQRLYSDDVDYYTKKGYDLAELAMTDFWDASGISYRSTWTDDRWDALERYVYEIDEATYKNRRTLPQTNKEILQYVENSLAEYED